MSDARQTDAWYFVTSFQAGSCQCCKMQSSKGDDKEAGKGGGGEKGDQGYEVSCSHVIVQPGAMVVIVLAAVRTAVAVKAARGVGAFGSESTTVAGRAGG